MKSIQKAKVFRNGRSQAVRIPAEFRFRTEEVYVQRDARSGALTLSEKPPEMSFKELFAELDAAGAADLKLERDLRPDVERGLDVRGSTLYMLDTNMTGYIVGGHSVAARERLDREAETSVVAMSVISQAEILFGLERKPSATRLRSLMEIMFRKVEVLAWEAAAAEAYAKLRTRLNAEGKSLAPMDMLIAAHAIAVGAVLVTKDSAFSQVRPFLEVVDWADDL